MDTLTQYGVNLNNHLLVSISVARYYIYIADVSTFICVYVCG